MSRRRNNNTCYNLIVKTPLNEEDEFLNLNNLQEIATTLNENYFSGLKVVSRTMISNWIHYPDKPRRNFANAFTILKSARLL